MSYDIMKMYYIMKTMETRAELAKSYIVLLCVSCDTNVTDVYNLFTMRKKRIIKNKYLVDPASSHMLVSKIKPCMSKHMP